MIIKRSPVSAWPEHTGFALFIRALYDMDKRRAATIRSTVYLTVRARLKGIIRRTAMKLTRPD